MFEDLIGPEFDPAALAEVALTMIKDDDGQFFNMGDDDENTRLPAAYTYFGQFVDHDLTLDKTSVGEAESDPGATDNFRTAAMDLDCVYGNGPGGDVVLYDEDYKLRIGGHRIGNRPPSGPGRTRTRFDQRRDSTGTALIGDPRNDENVIVAQMHQAFVTFHNRIMDTPALMAGLDGKSERFRRAARLARWHYQWVIVNDYLKRICQPEVYADIVNPGGVPRLRYYEKPGDIAPWPYMPIEFAGAAYRFGHSMVRPSYALNDIVGTKLPPPNTTPKRIPIFKDGGGPLDDLRGFRRIPDEWGIDWGYFLDLPGKPPQAQQGSGTLQPAYRIDTLLVDPLKSLVDKDHAGLPPIKRNLAFLNLLRGSRLRLPTAEQVAERMVVGDFTAARFPFLKPEEIWCAGSRREKPFGKPANESGLDVPRNARKPLLEKFKGNTPLWYYILREAEWYGTWDAGDTPDTPQDQRGMNDMFGGHHLGPIGSTIVLETFMGLLMGDSGSYIHQAGWRPMAPIVNGDPEKFELKDLIEWALR